MERIQLLQMLLGFIEKRWQENAALTNGKGKKESKRRSMKINNDMGKNQARCEEGKKGGA